MEKYRVETQSEGNTYLVRNLRTGQVVLGRLSHDHALRLANALEAREAMIRARLEANTLIRSNGYH